MTAENFCYWLQGLFEIGEAAAPPGAVARLSLSPEQCDCIKRHLSMVFAHDIDPKAGGPDVQKKLDDIHAFGHLHTGWDPKGVVARC